MAILMKWMHFVVVVYPLLPAYWGESISVALRGLPPASPASHMDYGRASSGSGSGLYSGGLTLEHGTEV